jgi:hypothetical protein
MKRSKWKRAVSRMLKKSKPHRCSPLCLELLEPRQMLSGYRTITGFDNNLANPTWGQAGTDLLRISPIAYADGISTPSQPNTISPRELSNNLNNQSDPIFSGADNLGPPQSMDLSDFAYVWGQFIDHDMDLTPDSSGQQFAIPADSTRANDPMGPGPESFTRSLFDPNTGTSTSNPRQQINAVTSYLDLSQVYGSSQVVADALRTHSGGLLKTSPGDLLPYNNLAYFTQDQLDALNMANPLFPYVPNSILFAAGDVRANENIELTAMQTLFVGNHNRLAEELQALNPHGFGFSSWTDENLYQEARKLNIATEEMITYNEFLPAILGSTVLPEYTGYKNNVNAAIATEFSTVGYRFGHSMLSNGVSRNNNDGTDIADPTGSGTVNLAEDFFDPSLISATPAVDPFTGHISTNIGAILKGDADNNANEADLLLIDEIRNTLFGPPGAGGTDLAARDIQRARDHGIGTYNQVRAAYGLPAVTSFVQITSNVAVQEALQSTYGSVDKIDPFEGMLAEDHLPGADVGPTVEAILAKQFTALRDGDRFFYLNDTFTAGEARLLRQTSSLAMVIQANTNITNLQSNVFFFKESITGTVFDDRDHDGFPRTGNEPGVPGITVDLNDASGNVVATATTDSHGHYNFTDQTGIPGTGNFWATIVLPAGYVQTTPNPPNLQLTRGGLDVDKVDFGIDPSLLDGRFDEQGSRADFTTGVARPMNGFQGHALAPMPLLLIGSLPQSAGLQDTSVASQPRSLQPSVLDMISSDLATQIMPTPASAEEPINQTGMNQGITDVLNGLSMALEKGQDDMFGEFWLQTKAPMRSFCLVAIIGRVS